MKQHNNNDWLKLQNKVVYYPIFSNYLCVAVVSSLFYKSLVNINRLYYFLQLYDSALVIFLFWDYIYWFFHHFSYLFLDPIIIFIFLLKKISLKKQKQHYMKFHPSGWYWLFNHHNFFFNIIKKKHVLNAKKYNLFNKKIQLLLFFFPIILFFASHDYNIKTRNNLFSKYIIIIIIILVLF